MAMDEADYLEVGRRTDGTLLWRTLFLHDLARLFGIQIHIGGWPYGASYRRAINCARDRVDAPDAPYPDEVIVR